MPILASLLDRVLASITPEETRQITVKWFKEVESAKDAVSLTSEESAWLEAHPLIRVAADIHWAPVEFVDEDGEDGIFPAFFEDFLDEEEAREQILATLDDGNDPPADPQENLLDAN